MRARAASFFNSLVKSISVRVDTLQNLRFGLNNRCYFWNEAFKKLDFAFSGEDFAAKNKIKTLDIHFLPDFVFCKYQDEDEDEGSEEGERGDFEDWDGRANEPFTMKIIPQLTNLTSLRARFSSERTFNDNLVCDFLEGVGEKLTKLEDISLLIRCTEVVTQSTVYDMIRLISDEKKSLPNLKNIRIDFSDCEKPLEVEIGDPIGEGDIEGLKDAFSKGRPEAKFAVTIDGEEAFINSYKIYALNSDGEENEDESLLESGTDDSDEDLSDEIEEDADED